ncbi:MAG: MopE-related protein [Myxococcota bacterium]
MRRFAISIGSLYLAACTVGSGGGPCDPSEEGAWYVDGDGDGFGDPNVMVDGCKPDDGWVTVALDCNDNDSDVFPGADEFCDGIDTDCDGTLDDDNALDGTPWFFDADGDGFGTDTSATVACEAPDNHVATGGDCDDTRGDISPGAFEQCDDVDRNCDGDPVADATDAVTWYPDTDGDGFGDSANPLRACEQPDAYVFGGGDCDDSRAATAPGAAEFCDGIDTDCDGMVDEDAQDALLWFADADGDGFGDSTTFAYACNAPLGFVDDDTDCDDGDDDVNPNTAWYRDSDRDGFGTGMAEFFQCAAPASNYAPRDGDCADDDGLTYPGAPEQCLDGTVAEGLDNDCDGAIDEACPQIHCGTIGADERWDANPDGHLVACDIFVQGDASPLLTILAGAHIAFEPGTSMYVGWADSGDVEVLGTAALPVVMTSSQDVPQPGDWHGLRISQYSDFSALSHLEVAYAGGNAALPGAVYISNPSLNLHLDHLDVHDSARDGLWMQSSNVTVTDSRFTDNALFGVNCIFGDCFDGVPESFADNVATGNGAPMRVGLGDLPSVAANNVLTGNVADEVVVPGGTVDEDATWHPVGVPVRFTGNLYVQDFAVPPVLTLEGGLELLFDADVGFYVSDSFEGALVTDGSSTVTMSATDPTTPWLGLELGPRATNATHLENLTIQQARVGLATYMTDPLVLRDFEALNNSTGLAAYGTPLDIDGSSFRYNTVAGLFLDRGASLSAPLTHCTVTDNLDAQVFLPAGSVHMLDPTSTFTGSPIVVSGGQIDESVDWVDLGEPYAVTGDVSVYSTELGVTPVLTLADGVELQFLYGQSLRIAGSGPGDLVIAGNRTTGSGVVLDAYIPLPTPGQIPGPIGWEGLQLLPGISSTTALSGFTIRNAGSNRIRPGGLFVQGTATLSVEDCLIEDTDSYGIYVAAGAIDLTIRDCTIRRAASTDSFDGYGVYLVSNIDHRLTVENSAIVDHDRFPVVLHIEASGGLESVAGGSTYSSASSTFDEVQVIGGTLTQSIVWEDIGVPYLVNGYLRVEGPFGSPSELTIRDAEVRFDSGAGMSVGESDYGELIAEDTTFTSSHPSPQPGDWYGIQIGAGTSVSVIRDSVVEYGGANGGSNLHVRSSSTTIVDSTIQHSSGDGISCPTGISPTLGNNTYANNLDGDVVGCGP